MRKLIFASALGLLLLPNFGFSLGMGDIEVSSALNQQLDARIELLSSVPEDAETLIVKLASREEFVRAGLDRPFELTSLKFTPFVENDKVYIKVTTPKPIREPFLNFLVEVDWPKGHLLREFTILLDPPVFMGQAATGSTRPANQVQEFRPSPGQAASPAPVSSAPSVSSRPAEAVSQPDMSQQQTTRSVSTSQQQASTYYTPPSQPASLPGEQHRIQKGDTAWGLANRLRPDSSVSVEQMMLAMLRTNPEVFINGNVNGLKRGYILRTPDRADINSISQSEALAEIRSQNALWRQYQQALSSDMPASAISSDAESDDSGMDMSAQTGDGARLEIVSAGEGVSASGEGKDPTEMTAAELREHLALANERIETERLEKEELKGQVSTLQQQVGKMKSLLTIEDQSMADIQSLGMEESVDAEMPAEAVMEEALMEDMAEQTYTSEEEEALRALEALTGTEGDESVDEAMAEDAMTDEAMTDEEAAMAEAEAMLMDGEEVFVETDEQAEAAPSTAALDQMEFDESSYMPSAPPSLLDTLMNNKLVLGGAALGALIIAGLGYLLVKRRRGGADQDIENNLAADLESDFDSSGMEDDLESVADMVEEEVVDLAGDDAEEDILETLDEADDELDTESTVVLPSAMDTVTQMAEDINEAKEEASDAERDDVIAEADVYLAYGIFQQAEELLQNAITEHPEKDAYRVKLAETYFAGKNASAFEKLAVDMKEYLGGEETPAWLKVAAMGKDLCPDAEVFQQVAAVADLDLDELMPKSPEPMDFDLGAEDTGEAGDLDLDLDFTGELDTGMDDDLTLDETAVTSASDELEFDIGEAEAVEESIDDMADAVSEEVEEEFSLDIEASELDIEAEDSIEEAMDFDLGDLADTADEAVEDMAEESLDDLTMEELETGINIAVDSDISEAASEAAGKVEEAEEDFDLDLSTELGDDLTSSDDEDEMDLSELDDVDEVSTKLDLARAYMDMGDSEGARDILDEVMTDGNDEQKKDAEALLKEMT